MDIESVSLEVLEAQIWSRLYQGGLATELVQGKTLEPPEGFSDSQSILNQSNIVGLSSVASIQIPDPSYSVHGVKHAQIRGKLLEHLALNGSLQNNLSLQEAITARNFKVKKVYGPIDDRIPISVEGILIDPREWIGTDRLGKASTLVNLNVQQGATCAIIHRRQISTGIVDGKWQYIISAKTLEEKTGILICEEDPLYQTPAASIATGVLVGPRHVLTAAHTFYGKYSTRPDEVMVVFGFSYKNEPGQAQTVIDPHDAYFVSSKSGQYQYVPGREDWALLELNRAVPSVGDPYHRTPVAISDVVRPETGRVVHTIGYPHGTPLTLAANAEVRKVEGNFFYANLDTGRGNSGSPVFDSETGRLLGLLVGTESDYKDWFVPERGGCWATKRYAQNVERGERCLSVAYLKGLLLQATQ